MGKQGVVYTRRVIAQILGVSERRVRQLAEGGVVPEQSPGLYRLVPAVQGYIGYLRGLAGGGGLDPAAEQARLVRVKREAAELDLLAKRGEMHRAADVEFAVANMLAAFKAKLETLPHRALPMLAAVPAGRGGQGAALAVLKKLVDEALGELADYDPAAGHPMGGAAGEDGHAVDTWEYDE